MAQNVVSGAQSVALFFAGGSLARTDKRSSLDFDQFISPTSSMSQGNGKDEIVTQGGQLKQRKSSVPSQETSQIRQNVKNSDDTMKMTDSETENVAWKSEPEEDVYSVMASTILSFLSQIATEVLDVSAEDIQQWMVSNEMSFANLLQPENLRQMVMDLNGLDSVSGFLTDEVAYGQWSDIQSLLVDLMNEQEALFTMLSYPQEAVTSEPTLAVLFSPLQESDLEKEQPTVDSDLGVYQEEVSWSEPVVEMVAEETDSVPNHQNLAEQMQLEEQMSDGVSDEAFRQGEVNESEQSHTEEFLFDHHSDSRRLDRARKTEGPTATFLGRMHEALNQATARLDAEAGSSRAGNILNQVVSQIRVQMNPEVTSMNLLLHPETLGNVNVSVSTKEGVMTAQIVVQNQEAKEALESQMYMLKQTFESQGLKVESVEVNVSEFGFGQESQMNGNQMQSGEHAGEHSERQRHSRIRLDEELIREESDLESVSAIDAAGIIQTVTGAQLDYSA